MINFIVVDDESYFTKAVSQKINNTMMKNTFEYKIHTFYDFDSNFIKLSNSKIPNKIYILDIETKTASGLDVARTIRKKDINSIIIFLTAHEELSSIVARTQLMILTFICKFDDFENKLENALIHSLKYIGKNYSLHFKEYSTEYIIPIKDILYVTRDTVERKCLIKTDFTTYKVNRSLYDIKNDGNGELIQTHRCFLINKNRITKKNLKKNIIILDNGETIDMISTKYKKELV